MKTITKLKVNFPKRLFLPAMLLPEEMTKRQRDNHLRKVYGLPKSCRIFVGQEALDELRKNPPTK